MFRKILIILACLLFLASPAIAANLYVDTACGDNGDGTWDSSGDGCDDNGGGTDGAFNSLYTTMELATFTAGDKIWVRRTSSHDEGVAGLNSNIDMSDDGTAAAWIHFIGYPKASKALNCDWVNGDATVDNVDSNDMDREQHVGRFITGPDGFDYLITVITDANTFEIDRPYAGDTAADQAVTIKADEDYAAAAALEGGEVLADWGGDADDLPIIDFNDESYNISFQNDDFYALKNFEFKDTTDNEGLITNTNSSLIIQGCIFTQSTQNDPGFYSQRAATTVMDRVIFEGNSQNDAIRPSWGSVLYLSNSALYNWDTSINFYLGGMAYLYNVNLGVEVADDATNIVALGNDNPTGRVTFRDVKMGGDNGYVTIDKLNTITVVNSQKVLGAWKMYYAGGTAEKVAVTGVTPNKKLSDDIIEITLATANTYQYKEIEFKVKVYESRAAYAAGTYNIKHWIYNDTGNTLNDTTFSDDILLRCRAEAGSYGDATTEYVSMPWTYSDEIDILDAADADDWDFLQADSVVVDQASKIVCEIRISTFDAQADNIWVDPLWANP